MASNVGQRSYLRLELPCNFLKRLKKILKVINLCKDNDLDDNETNHSLIYLIGKSGIVACIIRDLSSSFTEDLMLYRKEIQTDLSILK